MDYVIKFMLNFVEFITYSKKYKIKKNNYKDLEIYKKFRKNKWLIYNAKTNKKKI